MTPQKEKVSNSLNLVLRAITFSSYAHRHQFRKDGKTPYISHPFRVLTILRHVFGVTDERVLAAAVLHDTIEDTTTDFDDICEFFGEEIASWVAALSKDNRLPEKIREAEFYETLVASPDEVRLIKLADLYDNTLDSRKSLSTDKQDRHTHQAKDFLKDLKKAGMSKNVRLATEKLSTIL